jgi:hypothetical protein
MTPMDNVPVNPEQIETAVWRDGERWHARIERNGEQLSIEGADFDGLVNRMSLIVRSMVAPEHAFGMPRGLMNAVERGR